MSTMSVIFSKAFGPIKWIKSKYEQSIANKMQLREKRLPIYQEAFKRIEKMYWYACGGEGLEDFTKECRQWYENNCLSLNREVRESFYKAINAIVIHSSISPEDKRANWKYIEDARDAIQRAVD